MSEKHLAKGDEFPTKTDNILRLYSMVYCPYAQRARIVLAIKDVPHEIVNVNTSNKPEWIFGLNSWGRVPILDTGSAVIPESLIICDYLDEVYPEPPLHSKDAEQRAMDKVLMQEFDELVQIYHAGLRSQDESSYPERMRDLIARAVKFEEELKKRGTFFGGDKPGMVDFMIWPWAERVPIIHHMFKTESPTTTNFPSLNKWCGIMRKHPALQKTKTDLEKQHKCYELYRKGGLIEFDKIV